jgi:hypothetical protein
MSKIKSIEKGLGEESTYFAVNDPYEYAVLGNKISEIKEEIKVLGSGFYCDITLTVYRGYDAKGNLLFEVESNSSLTIIYDTIK